MSSEWMKVMLEEIDRKRSEEAAARTDREERARAQADPSQGLVIESAASAGDKDIGDAAPRRDRGRGSSRS